jgi:hypothetical protein
VPTAVQNNADGHDTPHRPAWAGLAALTGSGTAAGFQELSNLAYDAGYGTGPAVFGLFAARTGYPAAFALTGILVLAVLPPALRERKGTASTARPL